MKPLLIVLLVCRVDILVFDTQGHRHTLRGRQGQTLVELLADNEAIIGEGDTPAFTHCLCEFSPIYKQLCKGGKGQLVYKLQPCQRKPVNRNSKDICLPSVIH